jgi:hypothetical protein
MTTAQLVEAITDAGTFETIATAVLRRKHPDFQGLIHTGINAEGKTIRGTVDGFAHVPGPSAPRVIFAAHTTVDKSRLGTKWLSVSKKNPGDLYKVVELAEEIRKEIPSSQFIVALTTNRVPDEELIKKTIASAHENGIEVLILDQSQIADFLDNDPEGQWLRLHYFGVEAQRLSLNLLRQLSEDNTQMYFNEVSIFDRDYWVERLITREIDERLASNTCNLVFLSGESGCGKSVAAYSLLSRFQSVGRPGFWIQPEIIEKSTSLSEAIRTLLQDLSPSLTFTSEIDLASMLPDHERLLIIVDDINRAARPSSIINKLISWLRPSPSSDDFSLPTIVVCPTWGSTIEATREFVKEQTWISTIYLGPLSPTEAKGSILAAIIKKRLLLNESEVTAVVEELGCDPILIGLFSELLDDTKLYNLQNATADVMGRFLNKSIQEIAGSSGYLVSDYLLALQQLCTNLLESKNLRAKWPEIVTWFDAGSLEVLRSIAVDGRIFKMENDRLVFRHDRILEYLLGDCISQLLTDSDYSFENLLDPYYCGSWGRALSKASIEDKLLGLLLDRLPLTLFEWLKYLQEPLTPADEITIGVITDWFHQYAGEGSRLESVWQSICETLIEVDSGAVVEILADLNDSQRNVFIDLALLRNGKVTSVMSNTILNPGARFEFRDSVFTQAMSHHSEALVAGTREMLRGNDNRAREVGLFLAGFLGSPELEDDIIECWTNIEASELYLGAAIWAASQCGHARIPELLDPIMEHWNLLDDDPDKHGSSKKMEFAQSVKFYFSNGLSDEIAQYLVNVYERIDSLKHAIAYSLEWANVPDAVELVVRHAARISSEMSGTGRFSPWVESLYLSWGNSSSSGRTLDERCVSRLQQLWSDETNNDFVKKLAFSFWLTSCDASSIPALLEIDPESTIHKQALWKRAQLSDKDALQEILPLLETDPQWFLVLHHLWCGRAAAAASQAIERTVSGPGRERSDSLYLLSEIMMRIPAEEAENIIVEHWDLIKYDPSFVQAALYAGTDKCLNLVRETVSKSEAKEDLFDHIASHYGIYESGRPLITRKQLGDLIPYLEFIDEFSLSEFSDYCQRQGMQDWSNQNLLTHVGEETRKRYYPSDIDLRNELDDLAGKPGLSGTFWVTRWFEGFTERNDEPRRAMTIAENWLSERLDTRALAIVGEIISIGGTRKDLDILYKYEIEGSQEKISRIQQHYSYAVERRTIE